MPTGGIVVGERIIMEFKRVTNEHDGLRHIRAGDMDAGTAAKEYFGKNAVIDTRVNAHYFAPVDPEPVGTVTIRARESFYVYDLSPSHRTRVEILRATAIDIVQSAGVDVTNQVQILPLAQHMAERTGCTIKTAKIRIAEAVRRMRHPDWQPPERGGKREGAGRPSGSD